MIQGRVISSLVDGQFINDESLLFFILRNMCQLAQEWQTLISGLLALLAAYWTVKTMKNHDRNHRHRKYLSNISKLPYVLSEICSFTSNSTLSLINNKTVDDFPDEAIRDLNEIIEHMHIDDSIYLRSLCNTYQIVKSRIDNQNKMIRVGASIIPFRRYYDLAVLRLMADEAFHYARGIKKNIPIKDITADDIFDKFMVNVNSNRINHILQNNVENTIRSIVRKNETNRSISLENS